MEHIHYIGICGARMSALAQVAARRGHRVSGSDPADGPTAQRLKALGITIYPSQRAENIDLERPDLVVTTAAIHADNPELARALELGIPVASGAQVLGRTLGGYSGPRVAIGGSHGKTTTTAMTWEVLRRAGLDPTLYVGGDYAPAGGNVYVGGSGVIVIEACEAYDSFLEFASDIAVVTSVEPDHLDYFGTLERLEASFRAFLSRSGACVYCADDPGAVRVAESVPMRRLPYGLQPHGDDCVWGEVEPSARADETVVAVRRREPGRDDRLVCRLRLVVPGIHNVRNALAAVAAALVAGVETVPDDALAEFRGVGRRFELLGEVGGVTVIDDYAHHPSEIRATIDAARSRYAGRRLVVLFQPHLYSRTRDLMDEFAAELSRADVILLNDIYPAREAPIPGVRVPELVRRIAVLAPEKSVLFVPTHDDALDGLRWVARAGDVVFVMGAGDVRQIGERYLACGPSCA